MTRLQALDPAQATGKSRELFDGIQDKLGMVPNMMRTMGNSPAVLEAYLKMSESLGKGNLGGQLGELLALAVAEENACDYCLSAHTFIGEKLAHINPEALEAARTGQNSDSKTEAALRFAKILVNEKGRVSESEIQQVKEAGFTEGEIGEIIAHVALNVFTNYFNNVALTDIDFPEVQPAAV